ncbi:hypothetical protein FXO38_18863 [Capsicum annuum]|nr:hypothetical protein FXO38_18863 [Capsicum annuum]
MVDNVVDSHASANFPYELLITQILLYYGIDFSAYPMLEVFATYDSKTFAKMGYVLIENEWCRKDSAKSRPDAPKISKSVTNPVFCAANDIEELKGRLTTIEKGIASI